MTVQLPKASTEFSFLTTTLFLAILFEAIVKAIVKASGKPSGIAETERAITDKKISVPGSPLANKMIAIIIAIMIIKTLICLENSFILIVNGDASSFLETTLLAILPISV